MARTFTDIAQAIFNDKNSRAELNALSSTSKAAIFRNWVFVAANAQQTLETIQDRFEAEVDQIIASNHIGTPQWYQTQYLAFQLNDDLSLINNAYVYAVNDPTKQIVRACSIVENSGGTVTAKVAKDDGDGNLIALATEELNQLKKYVTKFKIAGTKINTISNNADGLIMSGCTVYYDGIYSKATIQSGVTASLKTFMENLPFDGKLKLNDIIDNIQKVTGVNDVVISHLAIKTGSIITPVNRIIDLPSGYLSEPATPYDFMSLIQYVAI